MRRLIGLACLVIGVLLILRGQTIPEDSHHRVKYFMPGLPRYPSTYCYIGGGVLVLSGLLAMIWPRRKF